jgi:hypothetical protein
MSLTASRVIASRVISRRTPVQQQKRGIIDYLTNYPDKVRYAVCTRLLLLA